MDRACLCVPDAAQTPPRAAASSPVVELERPAPLPAAGVVPPRTQDADLAAWQDDELPDVGVGRPDVLTSDVPGADAEPGHGRVSGAPKLVAERDPLPGQRRDLDPKHARGSVHPQWAVLPGHDAPPEGDAP